jgi:hypothetical protein
MPPPGSAYATGYGTMPAPIATPANAVNSPYIAYLEKQVIYLHTIYNK